MEQSTIHSHRTPATTSKGDTRTIINIIPYFSLSSEHDLHRLISNTQLCLTFVLTVLSPPSPDTYFNPTNRAMVSYSAGSIRPLYYCMVEICGQTSRVSEETSLIRTTSSIHLLVSMALQGQTSSTPVIVFIEQHFPRA